MSAELEIMGLTVVSDAEWDQPREELVDVSAYTEAAIMCTVFGGTVAGGSTTNVWLDCSTTNTEERWIEMANLVELTANPDPPQTFYTSFSGPGSSSGGAKMGFARYLRVVVDQDAGSEITLDVRAIMKTKGEGGGMPVSRGGMMPGMGSVKLQR